MEYWNTVRDLFRVDFDPTKIFPADDIWTQQRLLPTGVILVDSPLPFKRYRDSRSSD
ncbi:hypothetical protein CMK14_26760 [Candidatus Poribacteria bacterium]|nr:hypothetical protein [Candidatus Poribacteria bacterium]